MAINLNDLQIFWVWWCIIGQVQVMEFQVTSHVKFGVRRETTQMTLDSLISGVTVHVIFQIEWISVLIVALVAFVPALWRIHLRIRHLVFD